MKQKQQSSSPAGRLNTPAGCLLHLVAGRICRVSKIDFFKIRSAFLHQLRSATRHSTSLTVIPASKRPFPFRPSTPTSRRVVLTRWSVDLFSPLRLLSHELSFYCFMLFLCCCFKVFQHWLGFRLSVRNPFFSFLVTPFSFFPLNLYSFVRSLSRFEFTRVFILQMAVSIYCAAAFTSCIRRVLFQVSSLSMEVLGVCLVWLFLKSLYFILFLSLYFPL
jgi:hypothetical protein